MCVYVCPAHRCTSLVKWPMNHPVATTYIFAPNQGVERWEVVVVRLFWRAMRRQEAAMLVGRKRNRQKNNCSDDDRDADQPSQPLHFDRRAFAASNRPRARKRRTRTCTPRDTKNRLLLVLVVLLQTVVIIALRVGVRVTGAWMGRSRPAARRMEKPSPGRFRSACLRWPV